VHEVVEAMLLHAASLEHLRVLSEAHDPWMPAGCK